MNDSTAPCKAGDRIRLVQMGDDPCPIPPGTTGTVRRVSPWFGGKTEWQISVDWDIKRSLSLCYPQDQFEVIEPEKPRPVHPAENIGSGFSGGRSTIGELDVPPPLSIEQECSLWQLADDPATYGDKALKWIIVDPTGKVEMLDTVFDTDEAATAGAKAQGWTVVPLRTEDAA